MKRGAILLVVAASLLCSASPAAAKGNIPTRSYAVITGPGLAHPIVFAAPWKKAKGGYFTGEGELFLGLAGGTGAIPAGKIETEAGEYIPDGVLPIDYVPSAAARGPRYRLTWFRDGMKAVAKQNIYPYAPAGPLVYTLPSSRRALILLFGRFQTPAHLWTGWGRATTFDLKQTLMFYGLPTVPPTARVTPESAPPSRVPASTSNTPVTVDAVAPAPQSAPMPAVALAAVLLLTVLATGFWTLRNQRRSSENVTPGA